MNPLHPGETLSVWIDTKSVPKFPSLTEDTYAQVCVVGGGIAGLTTAYMLAKAGKKVCVVEGAEICSGQSGKSSAHVTTALDYRYFELEEYHGEEGAKLVAESHTAAIEKIKEIILKEGIHCEAEKINGYLFAQGDTRKGILHRELRSAHQAGLTHVDLLDRSPLNFDTGPCLRFSEQLQFHPVKYLSALAKCITDLGGKIYTHTHVTKVQGGEDAYVETTDGFIVRCRSVVVATHTPINDLFAIHTKQAPYRSYIVGLKIPVHGVARGLYWDTLDPYHYIRVESALLDGVEKDPYDILVVGGEDHKTGQDDHPEARFKKLIAWARERFPQATEVVYEWSGQIMESVDGLAFLGHNPMDKNNVYVITGDSGNGITNGTIGAMLITDQIMGRNNPWEKLYNPSRISISGTKRFFQENANVAAQYADWLTPHPAPDWNALPVGEGAVFRDGLNLIAAYKNNWGNLELMSASCPHLAGVVRWNGVEKSWDCPCHGSRFDCHGKVIQGPAYSDLKKLPVEGMKPALVPGLKIATPQEEGTDFVGEVSS